MFGRSFIVLKNHRRRGSRFSCKNGGEHVTLFFSLLKMKKQFCNMSLFLCLSGIAVGQYCPKNCAKREGVG